ncbi:MAG: sn-glycerol-3-phosphate ABC transporter ATP-binding protein UgpC [Acutalibacteraceae bacterium]|nr:sn-glycerol-3-phosphate ABC transporter ATP-binding protein UgpC [Acutalibacteraceae bacterium]
MASISLKNIYKIFDDGTTAVNDFSLEISDREFIILVGPSGCGKSTTLRMIAGLESISEGEMMIGDRIVNDVAPKDRDIAMVFQSYALYPHMSVYRNMAFGLELRKVPKDEIDRRVREAAKILDIEHLLKRKPRALSGGQRQRVALGRAMVRSPSVFLLDEPLSNLDAKLRTSMRTEIKKLHKRLETTFIYVTHDQTEAMTMGDRIVVMKDGVIQQVDTPQNLYDKPFNMFVAGFIGSPQMNFLDAFVSVRDSQVYLVLAGNEINITGVYGADERLINYSGRQIKVGIRPEDIISDFDYVKKNADKHITARVEVVEMMGSETYLYLDYEGEKVTAKANMIPQENELITLALRTDKLHLFDPNTTVNIML